MQLQNQAWSNSSSHPRDLLTTAPAPENQAIVQNLQQTSNQEFSRQLSWK